jgi:hypothetical protein
MLETHTVAAAVTVVLRTKTSMREVLVGVTSVGGDKVELKGREGGGSFVTEATTNACRLRSAAPPTHM